MTSRRVLGIVGLTVAAAALLWWFLRDSTPDAPRTEPLKESLSEQRHPNLDRRLGQVQAGPARAQQRALVSLQQTVPGVTVDFDRITGSAKWISSPQAFLQRGVPGADPLAVAKDYADRWRDLLGHGSEALAGADLTRDDVTKHNGMRTLVWQQRFEGLAVFGARFKTTLTRSGDLVNAGSQLVPDLAAAAASFTSASVPVTVRDNDPSYFEFTNIGTQAPGVAFPVTISARSSGNDLVTAYTSTAALGASTGGKSLTITPAATAASSVPAMPTPSKPARTSSTGHQPAATCKSFRSPRPATVSTKS